MKPPSGSASQISSSAASIGSAVQVETQRLRVIEIEGLFGRQSAASRTPQYLMNAILAGASNVALLIRAPQLLRFATLAPRARLRAGYTLPRSPALRRPRGPPPALSPRPRRSPPRRPRSSPRRPPLRSLAPGAPPLRAPRPSLRGRLPLREGNRSGYGGSPREF